MLTLEKGWCRANPRPSLLDRNHPILKRQMSTSYYLGLILAQLAHLGAWYQFWGPARFSICFSPLRLRHTNHHQFGHHSENNTQDRVMTHLWRRARIVSGSTGCDLFQSPQVAPISSYFSGCYMHTDELLELLSLEVKWTLAALEMLHLIIRALKTRWRRFTCKRMPQPTTHNSHGVANLSFIYTQSSAVSRLTNPLCCAHSACVEFAPLFSLCPTWNSSSVALSPSSRLAAASDMYHLLIFGLVSLQLPGASPTVPGPNNTDSPWSAVCAAPCGRPHASRCPADDDLDPPNCSACCMEKG